MLRLGLRASLGPAIIFFVVIKVTSLLKENSGMPLTRFFISACKDKNTARDDDDGGSDDDDDTKTAVYQPVYSSLVFVSHLSSTSPFQNRTWKKL